MSRTRRWTFILAGAALVIVPGLVAGGCASARRPEVTPTPLVTPEVMAKPTPAPTLPPVVTRKAVVVLAALPARSLDPYLMTNILPEESIAAHIWEPLVWLNDDLELEPRLAESWEIINDFTWEFRLRRGVLFHNGEPFDARAVAFSLERARTLKGSLETFADDVKLKDVEIVDDYTLRLHLEQPSANLPYELASVEILPPGYYGSASAADVAAQPVGSGPYRFEAWDVTQGVSLVANPEYWGGPPLAERLVFGDEADAAGRLARLEAGQADIVADIASLYQGPAEMPKTPALTVESTRRLLVGIRGDRGTPLADVRVRQALNQAVDVDGIVQTTQAGYGRRYASYASPRHADPSLAPWPYDPDRARALLAEAGYPDGFETGMDVPADRYTNGAAIARALAEDLAQVGVRVEVRYWEWPEFVRRLMNRDSAPLFLLALNSRGNDLEEAGCLAYLFPFNPTGWYNADFEALLAQAAITYNREKRQDLLWRAQTIAHEQAPWIFLWRVVDFYGVSPDLDWSPRADGLIYLYWPR